ncbi:MAG: FHA domain-containing protein [Fimbriimonas sp.]
MGSLLFRTLVGAVAGLAIWALFEPFAPTQYADPRWFIWESQFLLALSGTIGAAIGGLSGYLQGGTRHTVRGLVAGLFFGAIGGSFGYGIGGVIQKIAPGALESGVLLLQMPVRMAVLASVGLGLGMGIGASTMNLKRLTQGAIGGFLGGLVAGAAFDPLGMIVGQFVLQMRGQQTGEVGGLSRGLMGLLLGGAIALFIGLVERFARSAWIRLRLGRNEGKEWSLDAAQNFIGRSEGANIPLFGDPNIAPMHAMIQKQGSQWLLVDGGSTLGTFLNGQRVQQAVLMPGSVIQIGGSTLEFLTKNSAAPARGPEAYMSAPIPATMNYPTSGLPPFNTVSGPMPTPSMPTIMSPQPAPMAPTQFAMPAAATFALVALDGPLTGQRFPIHAPADLGREGMTIPMSYDTQASRRHANISPQPHGLGVQDLNSTNGTFVNNQRVTQALANPGDVVKIGSTQFRVERS